MRNGLRSQFLQGDLQRRIKLTFILLLLILLLLLEMLSLPSSERAQEIMSFHSDARPVRIQHLNTGADPTYVHCTRGVRGREKLLTQLPLPVKKLFKERQCDCVRTCSTDREWTLTEEMRPIRRRKSTIITFVLHPAVRIAARDTHAIPHSAKA